MPGLSRPGWPSRQPFAPGAEGVLRFLIDLDFRVDGTLPIRSSRWTPICLRHLVCAICFGFHWVESMWSPTLPGFTEAHRTCGPLWIPQSKPYLTATFFLVESSFSMYFMFGEIGSRQAHGGMFSRDCGISMLSTEPRWSQGQFEPLGPTANLSPLAFFLLLNYVTFVTYFFCNYEILRWIIYECYWYDTHVTECSRWVHFSGLCLLAWCTSLHPDVEAVGAWNGVKEFDYSTTIYISTNHPLVPISMVSRVLSIVTHKKHKYVSYASRARWNWMESGVQKA